MMGMTSRDSSTNYPRWRVLLIGFLLVVAIIVTAIAANTTIQAFQTFQHQNELTRKGDISTIRSWMTIPFISRHYHVPENYLYESLHLNFSTYDFYGKHSRDHLTLTAISILTKRNINALIYDLQKDIRTYHRLHPTLTPRGTPPVRATPTSRPKPTPHPIIALSTLTSRHVRRGAR